MATPSAKRTKPRYVLVVEDNVHHAELLTEVLDRHFAPVIIHTVDTIEDGVEFAAQSSYDLIITGGVIQGVAVSDAIPRLLRASGGIPIIVISGRGDEKLAAEFIKRGAAEYLSKTRETLDHLPELFARHFAKGALAKRRKPAARPTAAAAGTPTPATIIREVDRLTQQALAIAGPRRRKRRQLPQEIDQLDRLLGQIQKLREMASKLTPKE